MLDLARQRVAAAGLSDRINLRLTRLPDDALRGCEFDAVISNSLLHHLADPTVLWETVAACARPGAPIMVMDLVRPFDGAQVAHLVDTYASDADPILRADFANSLFAAYMPDEVAIQLVDAGVTGLRIDQVSDRHMVITGRR
jgi:cyclopropane fatty-acyl-phospholipid synthase-like methyltransferase